MFSSLERAGGPQDSKKAVTPAAGPTSALELADGVLHVYDVAMEELKMQVCWVMLLFIDCSSMLTWYNQDASVLHVFNPSMHTTNRYPLCVTQVGSECRERGVLMGALWSQVKGVLELRAGLEAESRLGAMQVWIMKRFISCLSSSIIYLCFDKCGGRVKAGCHAGVCLSNYSHSLFSY